MVNSPIPRISDKASDLKVRASAMAQALRTRGSIYDRLFAWIEGSATVASGGLFAFGGAALEADEFVLGFVLLSLGLLSTIGAVLLVIKRGKGVVETMVDAINAAHEATVIQLEAENAVAASSKAVSDQKRTAELARIAAETQRTSLALETQTKLESLNQTWKALDRQRRARLFAMRKMVEIVEAALLHNRDSKVTAQKLLDDAQDQIRQVMRCRNEDYFTISIFRREMRSRAEGERMYRIGCFATVTKEKSYDDLSWAKGKGYTGTLWNDAAANAKADLVLPDTTVPGIREKYPVDDYDPEREARYVSVAAFPILIERTENVWGIVIATIDRKCVFDRPDGKPTQGVEMISDIAYVAALLAGLGPRTAT